MVAVVEFAERGVADTCAARGEVKHKFEAGVRVERAESNGFWISAGCAEVGLRGRLQGGRFSRGDFRRKIPVSRCVLQQDAGLAVCVAKESGLDYQSPAKQAENR